MTTQPSRRLDGEPETERHTRFFDLRASGYPDPIDQDGNPATTGLLAETLRAMAQTHGEYVTW